MRFKSFKIGKSKEKPDKDTAEAGDTLTAQITDLEEQVNNKTKELEATEQELKELSDTAKVSEEDEDTPPQPHGPLDELTVTPEDELFDVGEETDVGALPGEADEGLKVVEVTAGADAPDEGLKVVEVAAGADAPAEAEKEPSTEKEDDSINSLFNQEDDEVNPLANLINSLPDVTAQELLDDLGEIKEIIREWERS